MPPWPWRIEAHRCAKAWSIHPRLLRIRSPSMGAGLPCLVGQHEDMGLRVRHWQSSQEDRGCLR
jgi:hypothetical protein